MKKISLEVMLDLLSQLALNENSCNIYTINELVCVVEGLNSSKRVGRCNSSVISLLFARYIRNGEKVFSVYYDYSRNGEKVFSVYYNYSL